MTVLLSFTNTLLYFAWEDQSVAASCIFHIVSISCITALYESYSTVMQLIGQIQYTWENTAQLCKYSTVGVVGKGGYGRTQTRTFSKRTFTFI